MLIDKRHLMIGALGAVALPQQALAKDSIQMRFTKAIKALEAKHRIQFGVMVMQDHRPIFMHNPNWRMNYCSVFKWVLGAAILWSVQQGKLTLNQRVNYTQKDLDGLGVAPMTSANLSRGWMTIAELCHATITESDNPAANLLEPLVGGLKGMQAFVQSLGDKTMRFDRLEPYLNTWVKGDERDTSTASAMANLLYSALNGPILTAQSKAQLSQWMIEAKTGFKRIRAHLPKTWVAGDKTGTSGNGVANDVAFVKSPSGKAYYISVFSLRYADDMDASNVAISELSKLIFSLLPKN